MGVVPRSHLLQPVNQIVFVIAVQAAWRPFYLVLVVIVDVVVVEVVVDVVVVVVNIVFVYVVIIVFFYVIIVFVYVVFRSIGFFMVFVV